MLFRSKCCKIVVDIAFLNKKNYFYVTSNDTYTPYGIKKLKLKLKKKLKNLNDELELRLTKSTLAIKVSVALQSASRKDG